MTTALAHDDPPPLAPPPPCTAGPGWFQSSWDLLTGLDVCELSPPQACYAAGGAEPEPPSAT